MLWGNEGHCRCGGIVGCKVRCEGVRYVVGHEGGCGV